MKTIAETAFHHEGQYEFQKQLVQSIIDETEANIIKIHIILNLDEYMAKNHSIYPFLKERMFTIKQWEEIIENIQKSNKELMILCNDKKAIDFAVSKSPEFIEIHSVCMNDIHLLEHLKRKKPPKTKVVFGVGGTSLYEIEHAIHFFSPSETILMLGFQNYPTKPESINLAKMRRIIQLFPKYQFGYADHTSWDNPNNELFTLFGAAIGVKYIEKHVTTCYGENRVDYEATISINMFNQLQKKIELLSIVEGNGYLKLNEGEKSYSIFGPMKKVAMLNRDVRKGEKLNISLIDFKRVNQTSDMSQLDAIESVGKVFLNDLKKGKVLYNNDLKKGK